MAEEHFHQKLSFVEKAGYSAADAAANFVFMTMILFQTNFYTDVFGITAGAAATILLVARLWDAFADPDCWCTRRPHEYTLGKIPSMGSVHGAALVYCDGAGVHHTKGMGYDLDDCVRRHHQYSADEHLFHEQYAILSAGWRYDRRCATSAPSSTLTVLLL